MRDNVVGPNKGKIVNHGGLSEDDLSNKQSSHREDSRGDTGVNDRDSDRASPRISWNDLLT